MNSVRLVQVVPDGERWKIVIDGTDRTVGFHTQAEAEELAEALARDLGAELQVHAKGGTIGDPT